MLFILLACIYISFTCLVWGVFVFSLLKSTRFPHIAVVCLAGVAALTVFAGFLSLLIPLGGWMVQIIVLSATTLMLASNIRRHVYKVFKKDTSAIKPLPLFLFAVFVLLVIVIGSWKIVHPDTLGYHAQTIQWIEKYKAIPGLVHLHPRFGYQGLWFATTALFGFEFSGYHAVNYLNTTVLIWFLFFITCKINEGLITEGNRSYTLLWLLLSGICLWSYTQVRLTAASASPDFIATLFIWAVIYLLLENEITPERKNLPVISLLCFTAVTIKLSAIPVLIIVLLLLAAKRKIKSFLPAAAIGLITLVPFVTRNIITSGYIVFPSALVDIAGVDWKYDRDATVMEKDYIKAYAKTAEAGNSEEVKRINNMKTTEWLPVWWSNRSAADKVLFIVFFIFFIAAALRVKQVVSSGYFTKITLAACLAGVLFWFINAPDPRFGFGFITGFIAIVCYVLIRPFHVNKQVVRFSLVIFILGVSAYTGYRFKDFFSPGQWIAPSGIEEKEFNTSVCNEIKINTPADGGDFGNIPVPCTDISCDKFTVRGKKITDGFRAK